MTIEMIREVIKNTILALIFLIISILAVVEIFYLTPPEPFPVGKLISIESGAPIVEISNILESNNIVRSGTVFKLATILSRKDKKLQAGDYFFDHPISTYEVMNRIVTGRHGLDPTRVTIFEGTSNVEIAKQLSSYFPEFDPLVFLQRSRELEGYLFPDTYFFLPNVTAETVIETMQSHFNRKIETLATSTQEVELKYGRNLHEIITIASIIEEEAYKEEDRYKISGVLWNRIEIGMPLQVDATFLYFLGKNTYKLTLEDLKFDSPYNTYKYKGLPPGPITNPGLSAIKAALAPTETDYLYYLADRKGNTYYAKDFETHKINKAKYVR